MSTESNDVSNVDVFGFSNEFYDEVAALNGEETPEGETQETNTETEETEEVSEQTGDTSTEEETEETVESTESNEETESEETEETEYSEYGKMMESFVNEGIFEVSDETEYEDSPEGLKQLIEDSKEKAKTLGIEEYKSKFSEENKRLLSILENGGSVKDLDKTVTEVNYENVPLYNKDGDALEQNMVNLVADLMEEQGYSNEEIEERLEDYQKAGLLEKEAKLAKSKLSVIQKTKSEEIAKNLEAENKSKAEEQKVKDSEFKEKVTNLTELNGFKLTKQEANKLYEFVTKPIDEEGNTEFMKKADENTQLSLAYLMMTGFNKDKLSKDVATKQAISFKKKLNASSNNTASKLKSATKPVSKGDYVSNEDFNFKSILM